MLLQFYSAVTLQHPFILYPWHVLGVLGRPSIYDSYEHGPNLAFTFIKHLNRGEQR